MTELPLSKERREHFLKLLRGGNYRTTASAAVHLPHRTLYNWLARGASGEEPFAAFRREVIEAEQLAITTVLETVTAASATDWRAGAWFLSRKAPEHWAERQPPPPTTNTEVAAEELAELLAEQGWRVLPPETKDNE